MRLWTFQNKKCLDYILNDGIFYSNFDYVRRVKNIDEKYVIEDGDIVVRGKQIDTAPIYCFASFGKYYRELSLYTMGGCYNNLSGFYRFDLYTGRTIMLELEVSESVILSMKNADKPFEEYDPAMPKDTPKNERWKWTRICDEHLVVYSNYKKVMREAEEPMEVLLPYIKKEWVVAYREFAGEGTYGTCKVTTTVVNNNMFPAWTETVWVNGDGYFRMPNDNGKLASVGLEKSYELVDKLGMNGCPRYFTILEAINYCNLNTRMRIKDRLEERGYALGKGSPVYSMTIMDFFPEGLLPV